MVLLRILENIMDTIRHHSYLCYKVTPLAVRIFLIGFYGM